MIFEYTAYWTGRAAQNDLLPFVANNLGAKALYALHRTGREVYGPLDRTKLDQFYANHKNRGLQTDIYATFVEQNSDEMIKAQPYDAVSSFA